MINSINEFITELKNKEKRVLSNNGLWLINSVFYQEWDSELEPLINDELKELAFALNDNSLSIEFDYPTKTIVIRKQHKNNWLIVLFLESNTFYSSELEGLLSEQKVLQELETRITEKQKELSLLNYYSAVDAYASLSPATSLLIKKSIIQVNYDLELLQQEGEDCAALILEKKNNYHKFYRILHSNSELFPEWNSISDYKTIDDNPWFQSIIKKEEL